MYASVQYKLAELEDPHVKLQLLRSFVKSLTYYGVSLLHLTYITALVELCAVAFLIMHGCKPLCIFVLETWVYVSHIQLFLTLVIQPGFWYLVYCQF